MKFCCLEENPGGLSGEAGHGPDPKGGSLRGRDCKGPLGERGSSGRRLGRAVTDTVGQVPCRLTHFPPKRARIHWPDSAACTELGAEEKIAPEFRGRSSFWSSPWHGLSSGASKGARNMCWSLSGGDKL